MHLSEKLRILLSARNLTQQQVGEALGIAHTTVGRWLSGKSRPYDRTAQQLAEFLGTDVGLLIDDSVEIPSEMARLREQGGREGQGQFQAGVVASPATNSLMQRQQQRTNAAMRIAEAMMQPERHAHGQDLFPEQFGGRVEATDTTITTSVLLAKLSMDLLQLSLQAQTSSADVTTKAEQLLGEGLAQLRKQRKSDGDKTQKQ